MRDTINKYEFSDEELEQELNVWEIKAHKNGFASCYKKLYKTNYTTIAAKSFLIPNKETGEIRHFDLSLRIFKRRRKADPWVEKTEVKEHDHGVHRQIDINVGNGIAVKALHEFLSAQYEFIGQKIENDRIIIDQPSDQDIIQMLRKMSLDQFEKFGEGFRLNTIKGYRDFIKNNLDKNETFFQNWLDEENGKFRHQRCLIFGLEFIDHKMEGELSRKRFDLLTRSSLSKNEYVIIEMKSPNEDVFKVLTLSTNQGESVEYHLSPAISRAIPQILRYRSKLQTISEDDDDLRRIGIKKGNVAKCIILIGQRKTDPIWNDHFNSLKASLSSNLEIWTYTDIIDKLEIVIKNLEENLSEFTVEDES